MSSLRNDAFDMTILPKSALRRKRAGKENSESSVGFGQIIKILAAASLLCTYPIQLEAAYRCAVEQLKKEEKDAIKYGVRALLVVLSSIFVFFVHPDRMIFFMGIIGSICLTFLMYIVPGLVPFCTENYGKLYWMGIVGILAMLTGTVIFIGGILENSRNCDQMEFLGFSFDAYC
uniref:Amino acid transporter transmembrane domain-containing protein n=1 Tax=Glossina pallidipes TaxID=7398 RepID=A0A1A9ZV64_GLOPL